MKRLIRASANIKDIDSVANAIFNNLFDEYRNDFKNHTDEGRTAIERAIISGYPEYDFSLEDIDRIIVAVEDEADSYFSTWSDYFGAAAAKKYGSKIQELFDQQVISKRISDLDSTGPDVIGLNTVANALGTVSSQVIQALEGMCYEGRACEVTDSAYFVGTWEQWKRM